MASRCEGTDPIVWACFVFQGTDGLSWLTFPGAATLVIDALFAMRSVAVLVLMFVIVANLDIVRRGACWQLDELFGELVAVSAVAVRLVCCCLAAAISNRASSNFCLGFALSSVIFLILIARSSSTSLCVAGKPCHTQ